jgi:hypothetical protein
MVHRRYECHRFWHVEQSRYYHQHSVNNVRNKRGHVKSILEPLSVLRCYFYRLLPDPGFCL